MFYRNIACTVRSEWRKLLAILRQAIRQDDGLDFMLDSDANNAMKMLQEKLESLIAMVNNTSCSAPKPTTRPMPPTTPAVPASSCKEQYERDK
ncbi:hypothetical protein OS493_005670 [Desmophyllum pertusum]|uniref:Uncharacterized protein n=1 Tax=Desmophyllum pertusum TaxID=174260 RepID=A0A9W9YSV6_9CNID|nr:hypothetical protein OS493_005670 [Desmophyllum pertusum]